MHPSPVIDAILKRRSIREYSAEPVAMSDLRTLVEAGIWAPSGLNNQPWRFAIIQDETIKAQLAKLTHYSHIVLAAPSLIAVYLAKSDMYDEVKDHQAAGACIQNMLLAAEALDLGAVWLGQILKNKKAVNEVLAIEEDHDLMALLAIGHPAHHRQKSTRKPLDHFILKTF